MEKITKIDFVFVQEDEFSDPYYECIMDGLIYGSIDFDRGVWLGYLVDTSRYSSAIFKEIAKKIDQLNKSLIEQRNEFFGLF